MIHRSLSGSKETYFKIYIIGNKIIRSNDFYDLQKFVFLWSYQQVDFYGWELYLAPIENLLIKIWFEENKPIHKPRWNLQEEEHKILSKYFTKYLKYFSLHKMNFLFQNIWIWHSWSETFQSFAFKTFFFIKNYLCRKQKKKKVQIISNP